MYCMLTRLSNWNQLIEFFIGITILLKRVWAVLLADYIHVKIDAEIGAASTYTVPHIRGVEYWEYQVQGFWFRGTPDC